MTAWDIGDEDIWRLAVLILELPKENSSQPGSKDSRYWLGLLRPVLIVEDDVGSSNPKSLCASFRFRYGYARIGRRFGLVRFHECIYATRHTCQEK